MKTSDFDYNLPPELIAQEPPPERSEARMMVLDRSRGTIEHSAIMELPAFLNQGDLAVFNNTKVFPARTRGFREDTNGKVELVFVRQLTGEEERGKYCCSQWICIFGSGSRTRAGQRVRVCDESVTAEITEVLDQGHVKVDVTASGPLMNILEQSGEVPLPPYIDRLPEDSDRLRYQTVYASRSGAVAAPTAGLHFTQELIAGLKAKGIDECQITLHVGPGTFLPVKVREVEDHVMHSEHYTIEPDAADAVRSTRGRGGRVVAVGTTTVRTLEGVYARHGGIIADSGETDIFIYPPFKFKAVNALLTNFHLPMSTLLMMVSAFAGKDFILEAYAEAVRNRYRFFSYGDCMLII